MFSLSEQPAALTALKDLFRALEIPLADYWARMALTQLGPAVGSALSENPYDLLTVLPETTFPQIDQYARYKLRVPLNHPDRIRTGCLGVVAKAERNGHVFMTEDSFLLQASATLKIPQQQLLPTMMNILSDGDAVTFGEGRAYRSRYKTFEVELAQMIVSRLQRPWAGRQYAPPTNMDLDPLQIQAVQMGLNAPLSVITGPPGSGKTFIERELISAFKSEGLQIRLIAPTGKASRQMSKSTGLPADTMHRAIGIGMDHPLRFVGVNPLHCNVLIIDECSMADIGLFYHTLRAASMARHIIIIGDADQLPSVGPGLVLRDLIRSGVVPYVRLEKVYRQKENSGIIKAARAINAGQMPTGGGGFGLVEVRERKSSNEPTAAETALEQMLGFTRAVRSHFGPDIDVRHMAAMYRGGAGIDSLNVAMQDMLNPYKQGSQALIDNLRFRIGDPVINVENDRKFDIFNGETGTVLGFDVKRKMLHVQFEDRPHPVTNFPVHRLKLAYGCSVHKMQGSQANTCAMPTLTEHASMLDRTIIYTALTRATDRFLLVADPAVLKKAISVVKAFNRNSGLAQRIREMGMLAGLQPVEQAS